MDLVVVYKASPESYVQLVQVLTEEGFNPIALENPHSNTIYVPRGSYRRGAKSTVYIAVPRDEKQGANSVLRKWDKVQQSNVQNITKKLKGQFFCSVLIMIPIAIVFLIFRILKGALPLLLLIWFAVFVLMANVEKLRKQ